MRNAGQQRLKWLQPLFKAFVLICVLSFGFGIFINGLFPTSSYIWNDWDKATYKQPIAMRLGGYGKNKYESNSVRKAQNIICYSLYGSDLRYMDGALVNVKLCKKVYPGWTMRVYYDDTVPQNILNQLKEANVELVDMTGSVMNKMSWRFQGVVDAERSCSRDIDSRLSLREKAAVDEWIKSGKHFHIMRDHPAHSKHSMMAGMWCSKTIPNMIELLTDVTNQSFWEDMNFLHKVIWPMAQKSLLQHDSFSCDKWGGGSPFPMPRVGWEHVGSVHIHGKMRPSHVERLKKAGIVKNCVKNISSPTHISGQFLLL